jgi:hypothetical protein
MDYKIHGSTVFIKGNGIIAQYKVDGDKVYKIVEHYSGDELIEDFYTFGDLPLNTEAKLLSELRQSGKI